MTGSDLPVWPGLDRSGDLRRAREESARRHAMRRERLLSLLADGERNGSPWERTVDGDGSRKR